MTDPVTTAARRAATTVARRLGHRGRLQLIRHGTNVLFRAGGVVLRVSPGQHDAKGQASLTRWLSTRGVPAQRPIAGPFAVDDLVVTGWERLDDGADVDYRQVGAAISALHELDLSSVADHVALPWCGDATWPGLAERLDTAAAAGVVDVEDIAILRSEMTELEGWEGSARDEDLVVCHGDVHPQNVMMAGTEAVVLDWDSICFGPAAWDHAPLLTWAERWGGDPAVYEAFAEGYGADLRDTPLARVLMRVRLLAPTIAMIVRGRSSPIHAKEARLRMRYWRREPSAPAWTPR
jgi:aminoglycoside phosphotransferase (APT) family kinase protein